MKLPPVVCDTCPAIIRGACDTDQRQWCDGCATWWLPDAAHVYVRLVRLMCADILEVRAWDKRNAQREQFVATACGYGRSTLAAAVEHAKLGIVLRAGLRGTKGVGSSSGPTDRADAVFDAAHDLADDPPPRATTRIENLRGHDCYPTVVFLRDETIGEALYTLKVGTREVTLTLGQWVGLHNASAEQRARWEVKMSVGDSSVPLVGADRLGQRLLLSAAQAWDATDA